MSALPPIADIRQRIEHVRYVPEADIEAAWDLVCLVPTADTTTPRMVFDADQLMLR
jgi:hypothetical protein